MYHSVRRQFSRSAPSKARRTIKEIRRALREAEPPETPEELQRYLFRQSEAAFGPLITEDPTAYVNKVADDAFKAALKESGNDPAIFKEWKNNIKARHAVLAESKFVVVSSTSLTSSDSFMKKP
ncbi:hypothetical protein MIND_00463400 [Mycena indigotica]|uniref:Uncharacterized protein n=1 Tax=Mycena indigotica TaxID=2126181 RepID=A0A8H6SYM5_9AGAR|nr:uncharacterized protein MIND_00463400 [Mycena indigotica]KAF7306717.1 hypothetical protein MIND_00463400 [Mycena indigotica]